jgi:preprotein translocase subunit SecG
VNVVLIVLHVFVCVFLIAVVLLQRGRGAEIGAVFGGGASSTVFGSRGAGNFLTKLTTVAAVLFMVTSLGLSYLWSHQTTERLFTDPEAAATPAAEKPLFEELGKTPGAEGATPAAEGAAAAAEAPAAAPAETSKQP